MNDASPSIHLVHLAKESPSSVHTCLPSAHTYIWQVHSDGRVKFHPCFLCKNVWKLNASTWKEESKGEVKVSRRMMYIRTQIEPVLSPFSAGIFFSFILRIHEGSHREIYRDFQPSLTSSTGGAKGWSDHKFCAPRAYTAQLLTLHPHRANNQYRTANQI